MLQVEDEPEPLLRKGRAAGIDVRVRHFLKERRRGSSLLRPTRNW
jgi:hypothetical protein